MTLDVGARRDLLGARRLDEGLAIDRPWCVTTSAPWAPSPGSMPTAGVVAVDRWFKAARRRYRDVSPFPLAVLEFQCGQLGWSNRCGPNL